eukprot:gene13274-9512_t
MSENGDLQHDRDDQTSRREEEDFDQRDQRDERQYDEDEISRDQQPKEESHGNAEDTKFSIHITGDEIGFKLTEEAMKAFFEKFGEVEKVAIIRDPSTRASRRFGFITMARIEDAVRAVTEMEVGQIDGFDVKCQRAKRKQAYEKTPGQYLGPPALSSKLIQIELSDEIVIEAEIAQENAVETVILLANSTVAMIAALILVRNDRLCVTLVALILVMLEILVVLTLVTLGPPPRYDMDPRGLPPPHYMDPRGPPPSYDMRPRSPPHYGRGRSPPHMGRMDDRGMPAPYDHGGRAPPVANYAASSYYANAGNANGGGRNGGMPAQQLPPRY